MFQLRCLCWQLQLSIFSPVLYLEHKVPNCSWVSHRYLDPQSIIFPQKPDSLPFLYLQWNSWSNPPVVQTEEKNVTSVFPHISCEVLLILPLKYFLSLSTCTQHPCLPESFLATMTSNLDSLKSLRTGLIASSFALLHFLHSSQDDLNKKTPSVIYDTRNGRIKKSD